MRRDFRFIATGGDPAGHDICWENRLPPRLTIDVTTLRQSAGRSVWLSVSASDVGRCSGFPYCATSLQLNELASNCRLRGDSFIDRQERHPYSLLKARRIPNLTTFPEAALMTVQQRNNIRIAGRGPAMIFAHGFGCDQSMWRYLAPSLGERYMTILFDLVGSGKSELGAYDREKYASLHGHAADVLEIVDEYCAGPVIFVGHSVSTMIGMLAAIERPDRFAANLMIGPSPSFINQGDYVGGFTHQDIEEMLETLEGNYLGWSSTMAPAIMGAPDQPELSEELTNSFCRTDPEIAAQFARVTFLSDHRALLPRATTPTLILQCSDDIIAPRAVGEYMHGVMPRSTLHVIDNVGHCPHLSSPSASAAAMCAFLEPLSL